MISHDLGCHIGPYGWAAEQSANLNRFAGESMRLESHFVTSPGCSQSRSSLVTGRYPHANGQFGLAHLGWTLHRDQVLLPAALRDGGYHTVLFGIWHLHEWTLGGFATLSDDVATHDASPEGWAEIASGRAADWIAQQSPNSQPFYLHIGFWEVHRPFCGNEAQSATADRLETQGIEFPDYLPDNFLPNNRLTRRELAELHQSVSLVDHGVGRVLTALDTAGLRENTLVLFTADHGLPFPRAKGTLYDPGIQVAMLSRWPGRIPPGSSRSELTSNIDVMPTLLEAAQIPIPSAVQGRSRLDLLLGRSPENGVSDRIFAEKTYHEHYDPMRCLRTSRYKYIRNFAARPRLVFPSDVYNSPSRRSLTDDEAIWSDRPAEELYDLDNDRWEQTNLADRPDAAQVLAQFRNELTAWMQATGDPLLTGPIPRPVTGD